MGLNSQGIWEYEETEAIPATFSAFLNRLSNSVTAKFAGTAFTPFTPTFTCATPGINPTLGTTGSAVGRYTRNGRLITAYFQISAGGTGFNQGTGAAYNIALPVPANLSITPTAGVARIYSGSGPAALGVRVAVNGAGTLGIQFTNTFNGTLGNFAPGAPFALTNAMIIDGYITYEAAS